jgi:class 3 adenylate cyclase/tetratricopeptide (TPR) repeat protein
MNTQAGGRPPPGGQVRKTVTIVFADLAGSTELGERLDPEAWREVQTRYFAAMRGPLERHGGTVEKYIGDAVMAVFGVPVLHEDDALRAVRAAVEMRDAMAELNAELVRELGLGIDLRIGVNTGEVAAGDASAGHGLVAGDAVNTAARLQTAAPANQILIGPQTRRLLEGAVRLQPHGQAALAGKRRPMRAWRVVGLARGSGRFGAGAGVPLVGRRAELRTLRARFRRAADRRRGVLVTVAGPAGIGKSRLLREFLSGVEGEARVVVGRCLPYGEGITYWPLTEIVNELAGGAGTPGLLRLLGDDPQRELVVARLAAAAGWPGASAGEQDLQWAVRRLFEALAGRQPLVAVFDDVHWAEPAMLDLIAQLAAGARAPILLVCSARGELLEHRPDWTSIGGARSVLRLEPLSRAESAQLLGRLARRRRANVTRTELLEAAEGNPLFLEHLVAMRADDPGGRAPPTIQALLAARVDGLPEAERRAAEAAAIEGRSFHASAVRALADDPGAVDVGLAGLVERELVRPDRSEFAGETGYRFTHILVRDAAYELLSKRRRADLHVRYADWLAERTGGAGGEEIAGYHLEQAYRYRAQLGRADDPPVRMLAAQASGYLSVAGRRALAAGDRAGAANLLERAAVLSPAEEPGRGALLIDLGGVRRELGRFRDAEASLADARRLAKRHSDHALDARAQVERLLAQLQVDPDGVARRTARQGPALERTLTAAGDHAGLARLWHVRALLRWIRSQSGQAEQAWRRAEQEATIAGDSRLAADAVGWEAASVALGPTPVRRGIARCAEIRSLLADDPWAQALALQPLASLLAMRGEFDEAFRLLDESAEVLAGFSPSLDAAVSHPEIYVSVLAGDLDRAERHLRDGRRRLERLGERAVLASTEGYLAQVMLLTGREREADRFARRCAAIATGDDADPQSAWRRVRARVLAARGSLPQALEMAQQAVDIILRTDHLNKQAETLIDQAFVLDVCGQAEAAAAALADGISRYAAKENIVGAREAPRRLARPVGV